MLQKTPINSLLFGIETLGKYCVFLGRAFKKPDKWRVFFNRFLMEVDALGVNSLWLVTIISVFVGAVVTIQTANNLENPFIPKYTVGTAARETILLEFSSTIVCLILAGKIGSNIASEIGTMRITEQIDALDVIGVNSINFLVAPKVLAMLISVPVLVAYSMCLGIFGGFLGGALSGLVPPTDFIQGIQYAFRPFYVTYSLIKSTVFAFIISTIASFCGYYTKGGALEVGRASTRAVVTSSIVIIIFNLILTQLMLS